MVRLPWLKNFEATLFGVSFLVHLFMSVFLYAQFGDRVLTFENEDALSYLDVARSIVDRGGFLADGVVSAYRTPVYPLFLVFFIFLKLPLTWAVLLVQNIIASFAGVLLYRLGRQLFGDGAGKIAGWMYVLEPYMIMTANLATTETVFNCLLIGFAYYFFQAMREDSLKKYLLSGALMGILALTRPVALYLPIVALCLLGIHTFAQRDWRKFVKQGAIMLIACATIIAPWSIRQYTHFGRWRITNIDAFMLYARVAPIVVMDEKHIDYISAAKLNMQALIALPGFTSNAMIHTFDFYDPMIHETKRLVLSRPLPVVRFYAISSIPTLFGTGYEYLLEDVFGIERQTLRPSYTEIILREGPGGLIQIFRSLDIFQVVFFLGIGLWALMYLTILAYLVRRAPWRTKSVAILLPLLLALYFVLFTLGPASHARYRMPSFPFWFLLGGAGLQAIDFSRFSVRISALWKTFLS